MTSKSLASRTLVPTPFDFGTIVQQPSGAAPSVRESSTLIDLPRVLSVVARFASCPRQALWHERQMLEIQGCCATFITPTTLKRFPITSTCRHSAATVYLSLLEAAGGSDKPRIDLSTIGSRLDASPCPSALLPSLRIMVHGSTALDGYFPCLSWMYARTSNTYNPYSLCTALFLLLHPFSLIV